MREQFVPAAEVRDLTKIFREGPDSTRAVNGVSLTVRPGETFGIVGESGCGKSTLAKLIMGLEKPTSGEVWLNGVRTDNMKERARRAVRPQCQMVFQDSGSSLNPRRRVDGIIGDPMRAHHILPEKDIPGRVAELLALTGLPKDAALRYPHEFSGGQRQRICIARALALDPKLVILDEPVSALDVSVQAQILNLLRDLQEKLGLTYIFIGHGLGAVRYISTRIAVMYLGRVVELGPSDALFDRPLHPYTRALLDAAPVADWSLRGRPRVALNGEAGSDIPEGGCPFRGRCPCALPACAEKEPVLAPGGEGRLTACDRALTLPPVLTGNARKGGDAL